MARKARKVKQKAQVGWSEFLSSMGWMFRCIWRLLCLIFYLNPFRYCCLRRRKHAQEGGKPVFSPSVWERFSIKIRSDATNKRLLLEWAQEQIPTFRMTDFSAAWSDGVAFCALLESVCPGCCPRYDLLKPINRVNNCRHGLKLAYRLLNTPQTIITPDEMASGSEEHAPQVRSLIQHIKWWVTSNQTPLGDRDWFRANRPARAADGTILRSLEPCIAKGGGLINGLVSKRSKFNVFTSESLNVSVEIEIKGPNGQMCIENIKSPDVRSQSREVQTPVGFRERMKTGHNLWASLSDHLFSRGDQKREGLVRQGRISEEKLSRRNRIPIDHQTLSNNHFLISYVPISAGDHIITIKWHGEHIPSSPFTVRIAASFDLLQRNRDAVSSTTVERYASKEVSFNESPALPALLEGTEGRRSSQETEPQLVTAAVLRHTSTVHRHISDTNKLNSRTAQLQKQATVTRKRVLRKVMTRGGEEIEIHRAPSSSSEETQDGTPKPRSQTSTPIISFDGLTDSDTTSRSVSTLPASRFRQDASAKVNQNEQKRPKELDIMKESGNNNGKSFIVGYSRSYSSDDMLLPSSAIRNDISYRRTLETPNVHRLFSDPNDGYSDRSPWASEDLDHASIREKLLEGGFITQMPSVQREKVESDSTLDSDSDVTSHRGLDKTTESSDQCPSFDSLVTRANLASKVKGGQRHKQKIKKQGMNSGNTSFGLSRETKLNQYNIRQELLRGLTGSSITGLEQNIHHLNGGINQMDCNQTSSVVVKKPVGKTFSDPYIRKKRLPPQRSSTTSELPSSSTTVKIIQSESLNKTCFYISQKPITESLQSFSCQASIADLPAPSVAEQIIKGNLEAEPVEETKTEGKEMSQDSHESVNKEENDNTASTIESTKAFPKAKLKRTMHRNLQQSLSLPTLSKSWKAFEIDPDDETQCLEKAEAVANNKTKVKRATLGALDLKDQLTNFNEHLKINQWKLNEESRDSFDAQSQDGEEQDITIPAETTPFYKDIYSPISDDPCNDGEKEPQVVTTNHSMRRGSLQRQDTCKGSSSESGSDIKTMFNNDKVGNKENYVPEIRLTEEPDKNYFLHGGRTRPNINENLMPALKNNLLLEEQKLTTKANRLKGKCQIKTPRMKLDRSTQVSYCEIKAATGWKRPDKLIRKKKKMIIVKTDENLTCKSQVMIGKGLKKPSKEASDGRSRTELPSFRFSSKIFQGHTQSARDETEPSLTKNSAEVKNSGFEEEKAGTTRPVRQSTVDTVDSGIVEEMNQGGNYASYRPRFIMGHRVLHRRQNRRRVPIDPKFLCASSSSSREENKTPANELLVSSGNARFSIAGLVSAVHRFTKGSGRSTSGNAKLPTNNRSKISSHRRRVMFARRILIHRRSSSRGSLKSSRSTESNRLARSTEKIKVKPEQTESSEVRNKALNVSGLGHNQNTNSLKTKVEQKEEDIKKWVRECSQNHEPDLDKDSVDVGISVTDMAEGDQVGTDGERDLPRVDPSFLQAPLADSAPSDGSEPLSQTGSTDDPNYSGFGISPNLRRGLLDELNMFSNITSPEGAMSRQESLREDDKTFINQPWEDDAGAGSRLEQGPTTMDAELQRSPRSPESRSGDGIALAEIRSFLESALSSSSSTQGQNEEFRSDIELPDRTNVPNAKVCIAQGVGLSEGTVGVRNNFQVATADAGNGTLTVGINGPRPHTVTETNVTYTGDNLYDVIYDVTQPGYYVITIKWSDVNVPGSPFISKVSY